MDYLDKLNKAIDDFEKDVDNIDKIGKLLETTSNLLENSNDEKQKINDIILEVKDNNAAIKTLLNNDENNRRELLNTVKELILESSKNNLDMYNKISKENLDSADRISKEIKEEFIDSKTLFKSENNIIKKLLCISMGTSIISVILLIIQFFI